MFLAGMMELARRMRGWLFPLLLFAVSLSLRLANPLSPRPNWVRRGLYFWQGVLEGRLSDTIFGPHPAVSIMWLAGAGRLLLRWLRPDLAASLDDTNGKEFTGAEVVASAIPLMIVIGVVIVGIYLVLVRLVEPLTAGVVALLIAFDPQQIAVSSTIHPDGLLSVIIPLGALTLVLAAAERRRRWLVVSGVVAGLGLLTKLPALVLVPLAAVVFGAAAAGRVEARWRVGETVNGLEVVAEFVGRLLVWWSSVAVTFVALWPAMWVNPAAALGRIYEVGFTKHVLAEGPIREIFFLGKVVSSDPGWQYYFYATAVRLTGVTFVFGLVGVIGLLVRGWRWERRGALWSGAAVLVCSLGFLVGISLTGDKVYRYALPLVVLLDIVAGLGLVWWVRGVAAWVGGQRARAVEVGLLAGLLALHLGLGLARWPYPANAGNDVLGGTRAADYVFGLGLNGEGIKEAVAYVNKIPGAEKLAVGCTLERLCMQYGLPNAKYVTDGTANYLIYSRNHLLRGKVELPRGVEPLAVVENSGLPFAWVYPGDAISQSDPSLPPTDYRAPVAENFRLTVGGGVGLLLTSVGVLLGLRR